MPPGRGAELDALAAGTRGRADGVGDEFYDGLAGPQISLEEVPLDLAGEEPSELGQVVIVYAGRRPWMAHRVRGAVSQVVGVEVGLLGDAPPFRVEQGQR